MELSLPAGNLQSAVTAFENGADSVYFGLKNFSARHFAQNFSIDDYRMIREYAAVHGKKIYITLNTIVTDKDIPDVFALLSIIDFIGCDGLLVQDWGVVNLVKKHFPGIALHASTQMAVQNADGLRMMKKLGFKRVVLPRELSLDEIESLRREVQGIELKVFVHGALCYCISGLCYASAFMLGRGSANSGTCAQVCRMNFRDGSKEKPVFSLPDLIAGREIMSRLGSCGIESVKIEGRLKGPLYVKWCARYYDALREGRSDEEIEDIRNRMQAAFSRQSGSGYFRDCSCEYEIQTANSAYQGHRGCVAGRFLSSNVVLLSVPISSHDGIMYFDKNGNAVKAAAPRSQYGKGRKILLKGANCFKGGLLYKIKDARDCVEKFNPASLELYRKPLFVDIDIGRDAVSFKSAYAEASYAMDIQESRSVQNIRENFSRVFNRKSEWFRLEGINISNNSGIAVDRLFIAVSALKKCVVDYYSKCDSFVNAMGKYEKKPVNACYAGADSSVVCSPVCFGISAPPASLFSRQVVEVNNISQLLNACATDSMGIVIGPYFNVANAEALEFFAGLLGSSLKGVVSTPEEGVQPELLKYVADGRCRRKELPVFIHRVGKDEFVQVRLGQS